MKEYISMEQAVAIVSALELRSEMRFHIDDLHAICNAAAEQAREDFLQELLGMDVEPVAEVLSNRIGNDTSTIDKALQPGARLLTTTQAAAMVLQEREACANVCESLWGIDGQFTADEFAAAIRNRKD